jgi:hypothetical protein
MTASRRLRVACLATALALSACTGSASDHRTPAVSGVNGTILASAESKGSPIVGFRLPSETVSSVAALGAIPSSTFTVTHASAPDPAGGVDLLASDRHGVVSAFHVGSDGSTSRAGPTLRIGSPSPYASLDVTHGVAMVSDCRAIRTLSLAHPDVWTTVGTGCWAALSPDGTSLAFAPDGSTIEQRTLPRGRPQVLVDPRELARAFPTGSPTPSLLGPPAWGAAGLAFAVRSGTNVAILVLTPSGKLETVLHEAYASQATSNASPLPRMAWQPGGELLAIADDMGPEGGVLRVFDARTRRLRAVGLDLLGFSQPVWSPDGRSLASLTSAKALLVLDVEGDWRLRVATRWSDLLGWGA